MSHSLAGCAIYAAMDEEGGTAARGRLVAAIVAANAPDLDLVAGMLVGDPNRFHRAGSHSLVVAAVAAALLAWVAWRLLGWRWPLRPGLPVAARGTALILVALIGSHAILDALTHDPSPPRGEQMLWPLTDAWVLGPPLFMRADKLDGAASASQFVRSLMSRHNARAMALEAAIVGPLLLAAWVSRRRRRRSAPSSPEGSRPEE